MAAVQQGQEFDWQAEAVSLKRAGLESKDIAAALDKHPATIRKVLARAREAGELPQVDETGFELPAGEDLMEVARAELSRDPVTLAARSEEPAAEDDPEYEPPDRILWTGENRREVAEFLGRGDTGSIYASNIDLPALSADTYVQARPGDTIVRLGENAYDVLADDDRDPLREFKLEAGEAVGPMPPDADPPEPEGVEVRLAGTRQLALNFGPEADTPVGGTIVLRSEKLASGFFGLGDVITGSFTARVVQVGGREKKDKDFGEYRAEPVAHVALITELDVD